MAIRSFPNKNTWSILVLLLSVAGCSNEGYYTYEDVDSSIPELENQTARAESITAAAPVDSVSLDSTASANLQFSEESKIAASPTAKPEIPQPFEEEQIIANAPPVQRSFDESLQGNNADLDGLLSGNLLNTLRIWKDNQGLFSTSAELLAVSTSSREIRLLKENGVTITVPFERLSDHDKNYIVEFVNSERKKVRRITPQLVEAFD